MGKEPFVRDHFAKGFILRWYPLTRIYGIDIHPEKPQWQNKKILNTYEYNFLLDNTNAMPLTFIPIAIAFPVF